MARIVLTIDGYAVEKRRMARGWPPLRRWWPTWDQMLEFVIGVAIGQVIAHHLGWGPW